MLLNLQGLVILLRSRRPDYVWLVIVIVVLLWLVAITIIIAIATTNEVAYRMKDIAEIAKKAHLTGSVSCSAPLDRGFGEYYHQREG